MNQESNAATKELVNAIFEDVIKCDYECWRNPTSYEIKFGEGAIHWRTFSLFEIGYNKKGELKKWFISPDDKLRYNNY